MKALYIIALFFIAPLNWLFMHLSNWLMMANSHIMMELIKRTKLH